MKRAFLPAILLVAVAWAGYLATNTHSIERETIISPAWAATEVRAREAFIDGVSVGELIIDGQVVFRIRTAAGGLSPNQRAHTVAERVREIVVAGLQPEDITTGRANGMDVVMARGQIVVTADEAHARINNTTPRQLAGTWAQRLESAVAGRPVTDQPVAEKIVPIISVGTGTRIGGAVVTGTRDRLADVVAVAQVEGRFGNAVRARLLVPVSSEDVVTNIRRVPQTSVTGLVDIRL